MAGSSGASAGNDLVIAEFLDRVSSNPDHTPAILAEASDSSSDSEQERDLACSPTQTAPTEHRGVVEHRDFMAVVLET